MTTQERVQALLADRFSAKAANDRRLSGSFDLARLRLTDAQEMTLNSKRNFGWFILCVRAPYLGREEVIVTDPARSGFWLLDRDGGLVPTYNLRTDDFS